MAELKFLPPASWRLEGGGGRQPASRINTLANDPRETSVTWTARGTLVPILYGRRDVVGLLGPWGKIGADLVVSYIWGIGPIDAVESLYINDAALPGSGVTVTHHLGTESQTVDATLAAAVAGYNDRMRIPTRGGYRGVAYTVLRITTAAGLTGFPRLRGVLRGLANIRDPRDDSVGYSDNPALCLGNYIEDADFGLGSTVLAGLEDAADWCDSLLGGVLPRCRIGKLLIDGRPAREYADLLAEYAECFYVEEGDGFRLIPDAPVDLDTTPIITAAHLGAASLSIESLPDLNAPTEVTVQYTEPGSVATQPWAVESTEPSALPGVADGSTSRVPTSVSLEGITRYEEAKNKADSRLARQQNKIRATWRGFDAGVLYQPGDVVRLQRSERGVDMLPVRIVNVSISAAGRHSFTADRYDPAHYPADVTPPGDYGVVPVGAIAVLSGTTVPAGWADFSAADGRYILCAGDSAAPGDTGGSATISASLSTTSDGAHTASAHGGFFAEQYVSGGASVGRLYDAPTGNPVHAHGVTLSSVNPQLMTRSERLVIKTGSAEITIPPAVRVFGLPNISMAELSRITTSAGRLLAAAASAADSGNTSPAVGITTASASDAHQHNDNTANSGLDYDVAFAPYPVRYTAVSGGGAHTHTATLYMTASIRRLRLPLWGSGGDYRVAPGMIFLWSGSVASLPADYVLCDGSNGTPDLRDRFIEISGSGNELTTAGDNTVQISGTTSERGHSHRGSGSTTNKTVRTLYHEDTVYHSHNINATVPHTPIYYVLAAIMYVPGE